MRENNDELFRYIADFLFQATLVDESGRSGSMGIGNFADLASFLNAQKRISPRGKRWSQGSLGKWIKRYVAAHPDSRDLVDWKYLGATAESYWSEAAPGLRERWENDYDCSDYSTQDEGAEIVSIPTARHGQNPRASNAKLMTGGRGDRRVSALFKAPSGKRDWMMEQMIKESGEYDRLNQRRTETMRLSV